MLGDQVSSFIKFGQYYLDLGNIKLESANLDLKAHQEVIKEYDNAILAFKQALSFVSDEEYYLEAKPIKKLLVKAYTFKAKAHEQQQDLIAAKDCYLQAKTYCESSDELSSITSALEALKISEKQPIPKPQTSLPVEKKLIINSGDSSSRKGGLAIYLEMHHVFQEPTPPRNTVLFPPPITINSQYLAKFLKHIGLGEQDEADKMLQSTPQLATLKGDLTDCSVYPNTYEHRVFPNITAFQYAVWALDFHMWRMIKQHMEKNNQQQYIRAQLEELNDVATLDAQQGWRIVSEKFSNWPLASWIPLIKALDDYVKNYDAYGRTHGNYWSQQVGGAQLILPAHVINEYSHPSRPFYPCPEWGDTETALPRTGVDDWLNNSGSKLGEDFAWWRVNRSARSQQLGANVAGREAQCRTVWMLYVRGGVLGFDLVALRKLLKARIAQARLLVGLCGLSATVAFSTPKPQP